MFALAVSCAGLVVWQRYGRRRSDDLVCAGKLKDLATTFHTYGADLDGFPFATSSDAVRALLENGLVGAEQTYCDDSTARLVLRFPGGNSKPVDNRTIVAFEPLSRARGRACVAFADGHARCMAAAEYRRLVKFVPNETTYP